jgi:hypothetical protein
VYLRVLDAVFRWCWVHVPWFADYCVEFVRQMQRRVQGRLMQPDYIQQAREALSKSDTIDAG